MPTPSGQLTYADVSEYLQPLLDAQQLLATYLPFFDPNDVKSPGVFVVLSVGGGAGFSDEMLFDRPFIGLRVVSKSRDYDGGEALALAADAALCAFDSSGYLGGLRTNYITRTGGRPQLLMRDVAERYHFTASYITEVESGLNG